MKSKVQRRALQNKRVRRSHAERGNEGGLMVECIDWFPCSAWEPDEPPSVNRKVLHICSAEQRSTLLYWLLLENVFFYLLIILWISDLANPHEIPLNPPFLKGEEGDYKEELKGII